MVDLLAEQRCNRRRSSTALICGAERIDYGASSTARRSTGGRSFAGARYRTECTVALAIPRSIDAVVALFAVLRSWVRPTCRWNWTIPTHRLAVALADGRPSNT